MIQWFILLYSRIVVTGKFLMGVLDLHGKHCSISADIPCGTSNGCDLKPLICTAELRNFQVAQVQMLPPILKAWLCGMNINSWFYCWSISIKVKITSGHTFTCTFLLEGKLFWSSCVFPVIVFQCSFWITGFFSLARD